MAVSGGASAPTDALRLTSAQQLDPRLLQLTFTTPALSGQVRVRVLLPAGYATSHRRYPVMYLLNGSGGSAATWTTGGFEAEPDSAELSMIVVMPDGGVNSEYTNWVHPPAGSGPSQWETFHIDELVPWIDAHFRTIARRAYRAIAGGSMGGLGAMEYAARHPDLFEAAASISGAVSLLSPEGYAGIVGNSALFGNVPLDAMYGSLRSDELNYRDHSPPDMAMNLADTQLWMGTYDALPGSQDAPTDAGLGTPLEAVVHDDGLELLATLRDLGIPVDFNDFGDGVHGETEFNHQLSLVMPWVMSTFGHRAAPPARISYASAAPTWTQWGWTVAMARSVREFSVLRGASASGFELYGSGHALVTTPPLYTPHARYVVSLTESRAGEPGAATPELGCPEVGEDSTIDTNVCQKDAPLPPYATQRPLSPGAASAMTLTTNAQGQLVIPVALGAQNTAQEYAFGRNAATLIHRTTATITPAGTARPSRRGK